MARELGDLTVQQSAWLENRCREVEQQLSEQATSSHNKQVKSPDSSELRSEYYELCQARGKASQIMDYVWAQYDGAKAKIIFTPVGRAQRSNHHLHFSRIRRSKRWGVSRCIEAGGCCARGCGCCIKPRGSSLARPRLNAHCTPACSCCLQFMGFDRPIGPLKESMEKLPYDVRSRDKNSLGAKHMDSGLWGLI